jgi:hypothetical protein
MNIPNFELKLAKEFVCSTNCHIFLTGKAGTGKTTFLHNVKKQTDKRLVITAPTGIAAINAGGVTLHSFFQIPFSPFVPGSERQHLQKHRLNREKRNLIKSLDLLVIDEISMVRADLLDAVDSILRRYRRNDQPFGGLQLLMIGDLLQLSPVIREEQWCILQQFYASPYFFDSTALCQTELIPIELKHIYRQSDKQFIKLLNRVRDNHLDAGTLQQLNRRFIRNFMPHENEGYITLCTHNKNADAINALRLQSLPGKSYFFKAELEGDFPQHAYPTAAALELKVGAQVMFIRNDASSEKRYFNGKIGKITKITYDSVRVSCPEDFESIEVERIAWENIEYAVNPETAEISEKTIGTFKQYPLKLAWAITIHKSQGLTFDKAIIDAQAAFAYGQVYVALSRCRTLEGMVLSSPLSMQTVKTDSTVQRFLKETQENPPSSATLETAKIRYQQQLLLECFSFEELKFLVGRLNALVDRYSGRVQVLGQGRIIDVHQKTLAEICTIGEKFKRQLQRLFKENQMPATDPVVLERLAKASAYFQDKINAIPIPFLKDIQIHTDNREIEKKIKETLSRLKRVTYVKQAAVKSCQNGFSPSQYTRAILRAEIDFDPPDRRPKSNTYSEADVNHPELFLTLKKWRKEKADEENIAAFQVLHQKTLVQIAVHLPDTLFALKKVRGIGKRLASRYGQELVAKVSEYRSKHGIKEVILPEPSVVQESEASKADPSLKGDTKTISRKLFEKGLTIPQIAAKRGLVVSTIESHLEFFVERGELAISAVVLDQKREAIEPKIADWDGNSLKTLKESLGNDYSYGEIKLVLAHLKHLKGGETD